MSHKTVYLGTTQFSVFTVSVRLTRTAVSGANRGIGYGLAAALATRPNTIVFANLVAKHPNVHPIKLTSGDEVDNAAAAVEIQKIAGHIDVLIANAGISKYYGSLTTTPLSEFRDHWEVNSLGLVVLFQAVHKLLFASPTGAPKLAYISSVLGSIGGYIDLAATAYSASKAAANYLVKVLDVENPSLITLAISPGWVATEMGNLGAVSSGMPQAPETSGRFWNFKIETEGKPWNVATDEIPW
ncbi:hypothetical protein B0H14DRAFT_3549604 [Mycena olivaceomarginata]|nr:hypothetical protein B0H14DRAFT_3549604 [Mycena olivaceomarginata]